MVALGLVVSLFCLGSVLHSSFHIGVTDAFTPPAARALHSIFPVAPSKSEKSISAVYHGQKRGLRVLSFALKSLEDAATGSNSTSSDADNESPDQVPDALPSEATSSPPSGTKIRRLKDVMWVRETLEDLTAAEFACTVEAHDEEEESNRRFKRKRKRAVDYERLLTKLNSRIRDLGCDNMMADYTHTSDFMCELEAGTGMGRLTYTENERSALLKRLIRTRKQLLEVIQGNAAEMGNIEDEPFLQLPELPRMEIPKENEDDANVAGPKLYVRDDGTVDWDGALQDRAALRKFGTAVWQRINGRDWDAANDNDDNDDEESEAVEAKKPSAIMNQVTAKVAETEEIKRAREKLDSLRKELVQMETDHYRLLDSAISQGQATANVRLATLAPELRSKIQQSTDALDDLKVKVSFQTLVYELERIYTYLLGELGNPAVTGYIPLQDRLNVAEFGLLESQLDSFIRQFSNDESVDEDVLAVVNEQLTDFKRRLGIDYYVAGLSFDREAIGQWLGELWIKTKNGLAFYVKGVRLFWNDIVFCLRLINRAAQGYTLKPREVRNIRRTFKDIITFIPFVIILLIPLSPIGHVLVFGAIQRFFPDFFPSCFTEQRQNLLQLYETAEYSELTINETWQKKLSRFSEAVLFTTANALRTLVFRVGTLINGASRKTDDDTS